MTAPVTGPDKRYHLMHCKQRSYLAVGKHVVMVHTIQTHDIQTELNTFYPVHFPKTKNKLEEFEVGKSISESKIGVLFKFHAVKLQTLVRDYLVWQRFL